MSKRFTILALAGLVALFVVIFFTTSSESTGPLPKFVLAQTQPTGPFGSIHYGWDDAAPFREGKMWLWTAVSRTNHHSFLYDIDRQQVIGELFNAGAIVANGDQTKLLCYGPPSAATSAKGRLISLLHKITFGKVPLLATNVVETFWLLDLKNNSARQLGDFFQWPGTSSRWYPSPGFRYAYNVPNNTGSPNALYLADLDAGTFTKIRFSGYPYTGWWDDHTLLTKDSDNNLILLDVITQKTSTLFPSESISKRLTEMGITNSLSEVSLLFSWRATNFNVLLTGDRHWSWYTNGSFLVKIDRAGPALKLINPNFKFKWLGTFDADASHYAFDGENGGYGQGGNGGVYLRDLSNNTVRTIVEPDNVGQYALGRFYKNSIIYFRGRVPWRISLTSSNNAPLFPQLTGTNTVSTTSR